MEELKLRNIEDLKKGDTFIFKETELFYIGEREGLIISEPSAKLRLSKRMKIVFGMTLKLKKGIQVLS